MGRKNRRRRLTAASAVDDDGDNEALSEAESAAALVMEGLDAGGVLRHRRLLQASSGPDLLRAFYSVSPTGCPEASLLTDVLLSSMSGK